MKLNPAANAVTRSPVRVGLLALAFAVGCSSSDPSQEVEPNGSGAETSPTGGASDEASDDADLDPEAASDSGDESGSTSSDGGSEEGSTSMGAEPPSPEPGEFDGCPAELPEAWIFCEDFEAGHDPAAVFFDYHDADGAFVLAGAGGSSGLHAMQADYQPGTEGAGFLSISFGENPVNASNRPDYGEGTSFDEVYWRFRVRTESGWPDVGPGQLTQITALAGEDWGQAMVASIVSEGEGTTLVGKAETCVVGSTVPCEGYEDADRLAPLGALLGTTEVFSKARSGQWQCVEARVRLNDPGEANGAFEFWVDGQLEAGREGFDWRGTWAEYGLNLISIENFWPGGPPVPLTRWVDDIVVSTVPIGCD